MTSRINSARFQQRARAKFGTKGDNPVPTVDEAVPVIVLEDYRPEDDFNGGDDVIGLTLAGPGAVAAETAYGVVWNPPNSGVLGIIESLFGSNGANTGQFFWTVTDPAGNAGFARQSILARDARWSADKTISNLANVFALQFWAGTLTAAEQAAYPTSQARLPTFQAPWNIGEVYVIPPGFGFGWTANVANLATAMQFVLRQHAQLQGIRS